MWKHPLLLFGAVAIVAVTVMTLVMVSRAPVAESEGTAPSVVTGTTGKEARPLPGSQAPGAPREIPGSGSAARGERGSGVEGVTSGGTTVEPSGKR